jgi:hypothetical protein
MLISQRIRLWPKGLRTRIAMIAEQDFRLRREAAQDITDIWEFVAEEIAAHHAAASPQPCLPLPLS